MSDNTNNNINIYINTCGCNAGEECMFSPSYGNFWHTGYVVINPGDPLPLNNSSTAVTGGISRSGNVINIPQAGDYLISYSVTIFPENRVAVAGINLNGTLVPNAQTRSQFADNNNNLGGDCLTVLTNQSILTIPANSTLFLQSDPDVGNQTYALCDGNGNNVNISIVKLSQ